MSALTLEYRAYQYLKHWKKLENLDELKRLVKVEGSLFSHSYEKVESLCSLLSARKDGEDAFVHPLNVVYALKGANITDEATLTAGIMHDYIEEKVDLYQKSRGIRKTKKGIMQLDNYESRIMNRTEKELAALCKAEGLPAANGESVIEVLKLLTRHKRDFYYRSISNIFECKDEKIKETAIQIKLSDRMHNVLSIENFNEEDRTYQCFKNLFILNNTKKYLLENPTERISLTRDNPPTERLFKRNAKATHDAFLALCRFCYDQGIGEATSMLQLAFKKFAIEKEGVCAVTKPDENETHLMRLFHGVVRKYDAKLHHEWEKFRQMKEKELDFCRKFFVDLNLTDKQVKAVIDYKDAYALREIITYLLYDPNFVISKFLSSDLTKDARIVT
ncbi:MAG: hypothetical protein ABIG52_00335 [Nanoarchaeota archaeon]|nr:hypothetical protein [Nanoarchaeota archaeon]